jgi:hypothetical protein
MPQGGTRYAGVHPACGEKPPESICAAAIVGHDVPQGAAFFVRDYVQVGGTPFVAALLAPQIFIFGVTRPTAFHFPCHRPQRRNN